MDSMRQLSTSLPRRRNEQPQELMADFKAAALSVTNLYRSAADAANKARAAGYQDALEDLITFLDKENLGLMDGEGWRVRQWATQNLSDDGTDSTRQQGSEDEQDEGHRDYDVDTRSSSPEIVRKPARSTSSSEIADNTSRRVFSEPPMQPASQPAAAVTSVPSMTDFTFRSNQAMPSNHAREGGMEVDGSTTPANTDNVRVVARPSRNRHSNHNRQRQESRTLNLNLGSGAGSKRKIPYPDFFDIDGIDFGGNDGSKRDGNGGRGGKRGRHV
ncbi:hypothetical protein Tdes44962_MAKER02229 [Teratosphaeria destructans]|uniref:Uncharacterized protein n=1 Tax=Teratosphaeria destructans TaxID=418781 RepID=A0A9W7SU18_9PEZI|nr:hypothetical protein Tdes44962_MAKER02229 [Teratosphaeria destructans]